MKELILFSQAPADIQYVLSLYDKNKDSFKIKIIVIGVENSFKFFKSLGLSAEIKFITLIAYKNLLKFLYFSLNLRRIYKQYFLNKSDAEVYFFSNNYDYVTAYFIEKLAKSNNVYFCDIYKLDGAPIKSFTVITKVFLTKILFGITVKFFNISGLQVYQYMYSKNEVHEIDLIIDAKKMLSYQYRVKANTNSKNNLLLLESNSKSDQKFKNYQDDLTFILNVLKKKYNIYIKPHPRLGYSSFLDQYATGMIESFVPAELLCLDDFFIVIGIDSASIATASHDNKYSVIDLFSFKNNSEKQNLKEYLDELSNNSLKYLENVRGI